ncbi:hypothetical protein F7725_006288, partial [Dissostichus mawsoni]
MEPVSRLQNGARLQTSKWSPSPDFKWSPTLRNLSAPSVSPSSSFRLSKLLVSSFLVSSSSFLVSSFLFT